MTASCYGRWKKIAIGATRMSARRKTKDLASHDAAVFGSVLAMVPLSPGFLIGSPVGIILFKALRQPEVIEAFQAQKAMTATIHTPVREQDPKAVRHQIARLAIIG